MRIDGRANNQLRPVRIKLGFQQFPEGSTLIEVGLTRVICAVTIEERVPPFLRGEGKGWVTAEYGMLPRSTHTRTPRENGRGRPTGRTFEIQRLIGRSLRAVTNLEALGERTFVVDCDVLQADGGTRTAAITGAYVALYKAFDTLVQKNVLLAIPVSKAVAATSVGVVNGEEMLDLCYDEDSRADVDFNVVMTSSGEYVEVQGTAEAKPFPRKTIDSLLALADKGMRELFAAQKEALGKLVIR